MKINQLVSSKPSNEIKLTSRMYIKSVTFRIFKINSANVEIADKEKDNYE